MSYSINARGVTKEAAYEDAKAKVLAATKGQTAHDSDREAIVATIAVFLGAASDDPAMDYAIEAYGHVGGDWAPGVQLADKTWTPSVLTKLTEVNCTVKVTLVPR